MKKLDRKKKSEGLGDDIAKLTNFCLLYTSPSPRD